MRKKQNRPIPISDNVLDAVKVSDSEEVSDQDTDCNVVECEESICVLYFRMHS